MDQQPIHSLLQMVMKKNNLPQLEDKAEFYMRHIDKFEDWASHEPDRLIAILDKMYHRQKLPEADMLSWEMLFLIRDMSRLFFILKDLNGLEEVETKDCFKCMQHCYRLSPLFEIDTLTPQGARFFDRTVKMQSLAEFFLRFQDWVIVNPDKTPRLE